MKTNRYHIVAILIALTLILVLGSCVMAPPPFDEQKWHAIVEGQDAAALYAANRKDGVFFNPWNPMKEKAFGRVLRWGFTKKAAYTQEEKTFLPAVRPDLPRRIASLEGRDYIAWIGHASFLMRIDGTFWLTDPMLSKRALLPARRTPPALDMAFLAGITDPVNVVISHNHYDHLDKATIQALPGHARVFVPLGLGNLVREFHDGQVREMDWWERLDVGGGIVLTCLPAQHWSRRIGQGFNTTLWASYLLESGDVSVYYAGDSGYFAGYREIGRRFPGIDYALMPLTAYHPRWFMHYTHMNAEESIRAFQDLGAGVFIPTQWGAFHLGDNPPGFPVLDLRRTLERLGLDPDPYLVMEIGEVALLSGQTEPATAK
jgi:N-acyl-phosphatidylethanolamine-hydrolysing phospholipase D